MPYFQADDCQLYYNVQGQGIPILFVHPPLLTHFNFLNQMKELSKDYQIITFDIRGHGRSSATDEVLTYPLIADDMLHLLDHLNIPQAYICGYSTGGSIALEFFLKYQNRALGGILVSGLSEVSNASLKSKLVLAATLARFKALSLLGFYIAGTNMATLSSFWKMLREERRGSGKNVAEYYQYSLSYTCTSQLNQIQLPILLVFGRQDYGFFRYAKILHEHLPNNELKWIQNVKHQIPTKAASELNRFIKEFVKKKAAK
ncbi:alpha/beta fold hydrolase [Sporolactobacillus terrae]|uniref:Hydrolase n=1 Tax=Sporolactobacillus terrae TaxID=269673 RepID=A0A5K7WU87_9BACL|nr:alpha/beta hydrolase [Sporolactobacillus terrae]BBN98075.1 hydrolase [Sporolactobacillus terrae]